MHVLHDNGGGITEVSKKHFAKAVVGVKPVQVTIHAHGEFTFELYGLKVVSKLEECEGYDSVVILESGFNSGYSGEGPNGSKWALELLGVSPILASVQAQRSRHRFPRHKCSCP